MNFPTDLYAMEMEDLDVILCMDWLGKYVVIVVCSGQRVLMTGPKGEIVTYKKIHSKAPKKLISNIISALMMKKDYRVTCHVKRIKGEKP